MNRITTIASALLCAMLLLAATPAMSAETPKFFKIVSTSPGGLWHTFGTHLADKLHKAFPDMSVSHVPGGSNQNHQLVSSGKAQMGFSFTPISVEAYTGAGDYDQAWQDARGLGTFYAAFLHPVVRAGIDVDHISDLKGRVVSPGKREWATAQISMQILDLFGITEQSLAQDGGQMQFLGFKDVASMMQDRRLDAFMYYASAPSPLLLKLSETPGIQLPAYTQEDVDRILAELEPKGAYSQATYPTNPYTGVEGGFPSPVMWSIFVINKDVPDHVAYEITRILYEDKDLREFMGGGTSLSLEHATDSLSNGPMPLHPGAEKYFREKGVL